MTLAICAVFATTDKPHWAKFLVIDLDQGEVLGYFRDYGKAASFAARTAKETP